jgi:hypothetical protein
MTFLPVGETACTCADAGGEGAPADLAIARERNPRWLGHSYHPPFDSDSFRRRTSTQRSWFFPLPTARLPFASQECTHPRQCDINGIARSSSCPGPSLPTALFTVTYVSPYVPALFIPSSLPDRRGRLTRLCPGFELTALTRGITTVGIRNRKSFWFWRSSRLTGNENGAYYLTRRGF